MIAMTYCDKIKCSKCNRAMIWVKGTLLCVVCDAAVIWDLQTPATTEEERKWIDKNLGIDKHGKKKK